MAAGDEHLGSSPSSTSGIATEYFEYVGKLLAAVDLAGLDRVVDVLRNARETGAGIYIAGNGGSAATASHFATDLAKLSHPDRAPMRVISLTDNTPLIMALANDHGFPEVFERQLVNVFGNGDVLIVISASGNSANLVRAVEFAAKAGGTTIGMLGFDGGALRSAVDLALFVPSEIGRYGPVEDVHLVLEHVITSCLSD